MFVQICTKAMFCVKLNFKLRQLYTWRHCEEKQCLSRNIGDGLRGRVFVREGMVAVTGEGVGAYTRAELAQGQSLKRGRARLELTQW